MFAYPQGVTIKSKAGNVAANIDTRADNGYIIVEPSNHISGNSYQWEGSSDPFDGIPLPEMPQWLIDEVKESDRPMNLLPAGDGTFYSGSEWDCMADTQKADLLDALNHCPNELRDDWLHTGMAIHSMDSGETGFNMWSQWSQSSPRFDAEDQARVWFSFKNKQNQKNKESLFFEARKRGWESISEQQQPIIMLPSPVQAQPVPLTPEAAAIVHEVNNSLQYDPDSYKNNFIKIEFDFPQECNVLNQIAEIINASCSCITIAATTQATLALASLMASRKYLTPYGSPCHLYLGVANTGLGDVSELRETSRVVSEILNECGLNNMIRESRITSTQALYKMLVQSPASLYVCDDIAEMITTAGRQNSAGGLDVVLNTITGIYNKDFVQLDSHTDVGMRKDELANFNSSDADDDRPKIRKPALSMLALLADGDLPIFSKAKEVSRGSTPQFLLAICDPDDFKLKEKTKLVLTEEVIESLYRVRGFTRNNGKLEKSLKDIFNDLAGLIPHLTEVEFKDNIEEYDKMIDSVITNERYQRTYRACARENMRRLMTVLAAFSNDGKHVATKPIMDWCAQYIVKHLKRLIDRLSVVSSEDGVLDVRGKVIEKIFLAGARGDCEKQIN